MPLWAHLSRPATAVTAVELYDAAGETVALLFGKRKPGEKELESWRELVARLPRA